MFSPTDVSLAVQMISDECRHDAPPTFLQRCQRGQEAGDGDTRQRLCWAKCWLSGGAAAFPLLSAHVRTQCHPLKVKAEATEQKNPLLAADQNRNIRVKDIR